MTIGRFGYDYSQGPNPDFLCLLECRARLCNAYNLETESLDVSMGMSDDFEHAVSMAQLQSLAPENFIFWFFCYTYWMMISYSVNIIIIVVSWRL